MNRCPATLLVPGWSDTPATLEHARRFLVESGWPRTHVAAVGFRDPYGSNVEHAAEVAAAVDRLLSASGVAEVAVVAHSMGGLATRRYLATPAGAASVHTAIFVGTPHRGTWVAWLAWGAGAPEMRPGSAFLAELDSRPLPDTVRAVCIRTPIDTRVVPGSSAFLTGAECRTVRLPRHSRMMRHLPTLRLVRELLLHRGAPGRADAA